VELGCIRTADGAFFRGLKATASLKLGTLFLVYWVAYSLGRFWIEGLRMDSLMLGPLRIAQLISLGGIALGLLGLVWLYGFKRPLPDVIPMVKNESSPRPFSDQ
jgi:phosphatidylglycerol:prolipoprotein diacylglycerol transferase